MNAVDEYFALQIPDFPNALCRGVNPELMTHKNQTRMAAGKQICCGCEHIKECAGWAIENHERGIWGGLDDRERSAMRRATKRLSA